MVGINGYVLINIFYRFCRKCILEKCYWKVDFSLYLVCKFCVFVFNKIYYCYL